MPWMRSARERVGLDFERPMREVRSFEAAGVPVLTLPKGRSEGEGVGIATATRPAS
jgi:hypothetical protein